SIMLAISMAMWALGTVTPAWVHIGLFVTGWVLQFFGHGTHENRPPAFARLLFPLLVGPLWILNEVVRVVHVPIMAAAFQPRQRATQAEP
ncbi:MAG: Mpo1-like protein, partial [Thermoanaerobaculia bacterium]